MSKSLWPHGLYIHVILQARILKWVAFPFSRGSSQPRDWTQDFCVTGRFFTSWATREALSDVKGKRNQSQLFLHPDDGNQARALSCLSWPVAELIPGWDFSYLVLWRSKWQAIPVFLPWESQGRGRLLGCCLWGRTESDTTEVIWAQRLLKCLQVSHQSIKIILQPSSDPEAFLLHPCPPYQCFLHSGFGHHIWNLISRKYFWLPTMTSSLFTTGANGEDSASHRARSSLTCLSKRWIWTCPFFSENPSMAPCWIEVRCPRPLIKPGLTWSSFLALPAYTPKQKGSLTLYTVLLLATFFPLLGVKPTHPLWSLFWFIPSR